MSYTVFDDQENDAENKSGATGNQGNQSNKDASQGKKNGDKMDSMSDGTQETVLSQTTDDSLLIPSKNEEPRPTSTQSLVPPPPTPFFKVEEKFIFDDLGKQDPDDDIPKDEYQAYFIAFMVLGAGFHLPFNSFVAAVDYFMLTFDKNNMAFVIAATYTYTTCCAVVMNVLLVNKISTHRRIVFGYGAFFISLASIAILVACTAAGLVNDNTGFIVTILATFLTGIGGGVQEASFYGYAGMLPSKYTRAIMLGESFAGLMVSINRIVTKLSIDSPMINTIIFFSLSIVGEIVCILLHFYIRRSPLVVYYQKESNTDLLYLPIAQVVANARESLTSYVSQPGPLLLDSIKSALKMRWDISKKIWKLMIGILQVYFVSLLLYPGLASVIPSSWHDGWLAVILIATFNISDFFGTLLTGLSWNMSDNMLLSLGVVRWALIPFLLMCVCPIGNPIFTGEVIPITIIFILGLTTGYMGSTPMCAAAGKVKLVWREMTGNLMTMMMLLGLTLGATTALGLNTYLGIDAAATM